MTDAMTGDSLTGALTGGSLTGVLTGELTVMLTGVVTDAKDALWTPGQEGEPWPPEEDADVVIW